MNTAGARAWIRHGWVTEVAALAAPCATWMSDSERARLDALPLPARRAQFVAGRWLARALLAEAMGGQWHDWSLSAEADAPPVVSGPVPAALSISHSTDRVACAVGTVALGLDIEACRPRKGLDALIAAVTTDDERRTLASHLDTDALTCFTHAWTLKEASIKRDGGGLFQTMLGGSVRIEAATSMHDANACTWQLDDHVLALCIDAPEALSLNGLPLPRYWKLVPATLSC